MTPMVTPVPDSSAVSTVLKDDGDETDEVEKNKTGGSREGGSSSGGFWGSDDSSSDSSSSSSSSSDSVDIDFFKGIPITLNGLVTAVNSSVDSVARSMLSLFYPLFLPRLALGGLHTHPASVVPALFDVSHTPNKNALNAEPMLHARRRHGSQDEPKGTVASATTARSAERNIFEATEDEPDVDEAALASLDGVDTLKHVIPDNDPLLLEAESLVRDILLEYSAWFFSKISVTQCCDHQVPMTMTWRRRSGP